MGFFEIVVIGIIALVVFGPEKLPKVLYDVGQLWRGLRRSATAIRQEFEQTINAEVKADIHNSAVMKSLEENKIAVEESLSTLEQPLNDLPYDVEPDVISGADTPAHKND